MYPRQKSKIPSLLSHRRYIALVNLPTSPQSLFGQGGQMGMRGRAGRGRMADRQVGDAAVCSAWPIVNIALELS